MKIFFFRCFFIVCMLFSQTIFAENNISAAHELARYLNHFHTFQARFVQKTVDHQQHFLQSSQGTMILVRPGRFRWDTMSPSRQIVVTDGKTLWIYDIDLKQVTRQTLSKNTVDPAQLLSGHVNQIVQQFDVYVLTKTQNKIIFQLKPKKQSEQFQSILMTFTQHQLSALQVVNSLNQTTLFIFSNIILNAPINMNSFYFSAPKGVDVL